MTPIIIVAIVFGSILTLVALICGTILAFMKMRHSGLGKASRKTQSEEAKIIQEIYHGLARMEERIETLETILLDANEQKRKRT
jgi:uncharacterized membrane protein YdjX (TVP38/TMEM64 family)